MSYEYRTYPGASQQCDICKRHDCSKGDEQWLHIFTIETDGGYSPVIGRNCLRHIFQLSGFATHVETKVVERAPTDEEIGAYVRKCVEGLPNGHNNPQPARSSDADPDGQSKPTTRKRAK